MPNEPRTWIVGGDRDRDLALRCLLALEERFVLPDAIKICHAALPTSENVRRDDRMLAFVDAPAGAAGDFLGLLRETDARAVIGLCGVPGPTVAVGVAGGRDDAIADAVNLAVTTLIDWGYAIAARR